MDRTSYLTGAPKVRWRADLEVLAISRGLSTQYVVKDPVSLRFFHCDDFEISLLQQFDGERSLEDVRRWFERTFSPLRMSSRELHELVWQRYLQGLLTSTATGQAESLLQQRLSNERKAWWSQLRTPWAIRLPGWDPSRLLDVLEPAVGWIFSPWFVGIMVPVLLCTAMALISGAEHVLESLPTLQAFLSAGNLGFLVACIAVAKAAHELGHAIAARRFGCECHELGVLLLAGMPTLYCDVSDAWTLPDRSRRIAISLAGIWVELLIALGSAVLWWLSVPGLVNSICFNLTMVCSVGTLFFNANPLLRYDGYYVLMDLAEIPNLAERGRRALSRVWQYWVLGGNAAADRNGNDAAWLPAYGALSAVYRWVVTVAILGALYVLLKPAGGAPFVWMLAAVWIGGTGFDAGRAAAAGVRAARRQGISRMRVAVGWLTCIAIIGGAGLLPWPWYVCSDAVLEPVVARPVYAQMAGKLLDHVPEGARIEPGLTLARLENADMRYQLQQIEGDCELQKVQVQALEARRNDDAAAAALIPAAYAKLADLTKQKELLQRQCDQLVVTADCTGIVVPAPISQPTESPDTLPRWDGPLLDSRNLGAWIDAGETLLQIAADSGFDAVAFVDQDSVECLAVGQTADVRLVGCPGKPLPATVREISRIDLQQHGATEMLPEDVEWVVDAHGRRTLTRALYQVRLRIEGSCPPEASVRSRAHTRILVGRRNAWAWLWESLHRTFHWKL
jgi:putative peptide zinc metalloprotease protein